MSGSKFLILGVAAVAGIGAVALVQSELDAARSAGDATVVVEETPKLGVLTAARSLRRGENLRDGALEWREWPEDLVAEAFITSDERPEALVDLSIPPITFVTLSWSFRTYQKSKLGSRGGRWSP